ncbi:amino acid adenylation domain-containing protein [Nonomuraea sp. NPDC005650]|uniref:non-ribosomal peptide synthetase n=1 Tax=Nonomuraea sp. NPDC005650 TaxID=3157045 RepID=UPI0033AAE3B2
MPEQSLTRAQERLWVNHQLDPDGTAYNICLALRLRGRLSVPALETALSGLVARHQALRTVYRSEDGSPSAVVLPPEPVRLSPQQAGSESEVREIAARAVRHPFDLAKGPVLRPGLVRIGEEDHVLLLTMHHIATDEWSTGVLLGELDALYRGQLAGDPDPLPPLPAGYADVVAAERAADLGRAMEHWRGALTGLQVLDLPTDHPDTGLPGSEGGTVVFTVPEETRAALAEVAARARTTLYMSGLAAFSAFLGRYCGQDDVAVGTTVANRTAPHSEHLVGAFFNTLVMRADLSGDPGFSEILRRTRAYCLGALTHQHLPYPMIAAGLRPGGAPPFRVLYEVHAALAEGVTVGGLDAEPFDFPDTAAKYDLALSLVPRADRIEGRLTYRGDLFERGTAEWLAASFVHLLGALAAEPDRPLSDFDLLTPAMRDEVIAAGRGLSPLGDLEARAHELIEEQARRTPDAVAVACGATSLTYRELDERANRVARWLRGRGIGRESVVAVRLPRSDWMVAAFLGIWKAGAAYLPLDPGMPEERTAWMVADSGARVVLADQDELAAAVAGQPADNPGVPGSPDDLAYVIYTSGSTGRPKGVLVPHQGLVNFLHWCVAAYTIGGTGGAPLFSSVAYDMVVPNLFTPLVTGQRVHLLPASVELDDLGEELSAAPYGFVKLTPGHLEVLAGQLDRERAAGLAGVLVVGADAFPSRALSFWQDLDPAPVLLNEYGPTEASVANCVYTVRGDVRGELVPIGRPIPGTTMYVLDAAMRPVPPGVPGELYIGGVCVARGYHGRPGLTAERFVPDPYGPPGARLYRTGDLGRLRADGQFEFLGRLDEQVKINGFRVEPAEVQAALDELPGVAGSVVVAGPDAAGRVRLVAYVVGPARPAELRQGLARVLPGHMVPSVFVPLDAIPLNRNGKVERAALPSPVVAGDEPARPMTGHERRVAAVAGEVLGADVADPDEDLFGLGLDSLSAVRLAAAMERELGVKVRLRALLAAPTVRGLARLTGAEPQAEAGPAPMLVRFAASSRARGRPVYCFHPLGGSALCYAPLATRLERPVVGLQALEAAVDTGSVAGLARRYAKELHAAGDDEQYTLMGWSAGGVLAFETARQLTALGARVDRVVLVDSTLPEDVAGESRDGLTELEALVAAVAAAPREEAAELLLGQRDELFAALGMTSGQVAAYYEEYGPRLLRLWRESLDGLTRYRAGRFDGRVVLLLSDRASRARRARQEAGWRGTAADLVVRIVEGDHHELLRPSRLGQLIPFLRS